MNAKTFLIFPVILASLSACSDGESYYHKQQVAYSKAVDGPGLVVNPPLSREKISDAYIVPQAEKAPVSVEAPPPPGSKVDPNRQATPKAPSGDTPFFTNPTQETEEVLEQENENLEAEDQQMNDPGVQTGDSNEEMEAFNE